MSERTDLLNLTSDLSEIIASYSDELVKEGNEIVEENAKALCSDIPNTTAFKDGKDQYHLRNEFLVSKRKKEGETAYVVHASTKHHKYSIVHLVENGHVNHWFTPSTPTSLPFVPPHPFLVPLAEKYGQQLQEQLKKLIAGQNK